MDFHDFSDSRIILNLWNISRDISLILLIIFPGCIFWVYDFWGIGSLKSTHKALEQPKSLGFMTFGRLISVRTRTTQVVYLDAVLNVIRLSSPVVGPSLCPHVQCPHDWWFIFSRCRIINIHFYCDSWTRTCVISWQADGGANKWALSAGFFFIYGRRHTFQYNRTLAHLSEGPSAI